MGYPDRAPEEGARALSHPPEPPEPPEAPEPPDRFHAPRFAASGEQWGIEGDTRGRVEACHASTTLESLWAEAAARPHRPTIGLIRDGWAGLVGCAIEFEDDRGAVVLDFPADRLFTEVNDLARAAGWRVAQRCAQSANGHSHALRYVLMLERKIPVRDN